MLAALLLGLVGLVQDVQQFRIEFRRFVFQKASAGRGAVEIGGDYRRLESRSMRDDRLDFHSHQGLQFGVRYRVERQRKL